MHKVDVWVWTDNRDPKVSEKSYAYSMELTAGGKFIRRGGEGSLQATFNKAVLTAIAEALDRFNAPAEVVIHSENRWVLNMIDMYLSVWEKADFYKITTKKTQEKIENEKEWRRIAERRRILKLVMDPIGFDRSPELMSHALADECRRDE